MKKITFALLGLALGFRALAADSITFKETYTERLVRDGESGELTPAAFQSGSINAAVTFSEFGCVPLYSSTVFALSIGDVSFEGTLGEAAFSANQYTFTVRDEEGRRLGTISLRRALSQLLVTANFTSLPGAIAATGLVGEAGAVSGETTASIVFGDFAVERAVYYNGRQSVATRVINRDEFGEGEVIELHTITLSGAADYTAPVISVKSPRPGQRFETNTIDMLVAFKDNVSVESVMGRLNGADLEALETSFDSVMGFVAELTPGTNVFEVWALDVNGNLSPTNKFSVFHTATAPLSLTWDTGGTVTGLTNVQRLEIGRGYTITARPAATNRFGGWHGGGETGPFHAPEPRTSFIMQTGMTLHASFIAPTLSPLTLDVTEGNQVTGVTNGALLEIGKMYQALARPGPTNIFLNWSGSVQSTNSALKFFMQSNAVLQANFAPNPWLSVTGNYSGLVAETADNPSYSGSFLLTLTTSGRITGKLRINGEELPFIGQTDMNGVAQIRVTRLRCIEPYLLELQFDVGNAERGILRGVVGTPTVSSGLTGNRPAGDATYAGTYTFRIEGSDSTFSPGGEGAGTITVDAHGIATIAGTLGDGTPMALSTAVFADGIAPLHAPLYGGRGMLLGWLAFATNDVAIDAGGPELLWAKRTVPTDRYYRSGFVTRRSLLAARYTAPAAGDNALPWTTGRLGLANGNLPGNFVTAIGVVHNEMVVADNALRLAVTLTPRTGLFTFGFVHPQTGKSTKGKGALLQFDPPYEGFEYPVNGMGVGWFYGVAQTGSIFFLPEPEAIEFRP